MITEKTLLLANTYEPLKVISWKKAIQLLFLNKVETLEEYDREIKSPSLSLKVPSVVRLINAFKRRKYRVKFSRASIFARDGKKCQYCGVHLTLSKLTFDHVIPKARGGKTSWDNVVSSCAPCNKQKASKTLKEAGMRLKKKPKEPDWLPHIYIKISEESVPQAWMEYLYWTGALDER